jgi:hypothetical protein
MGRGHFTDLDFPPPDPDQARRCIVCCVWSDAGPRDLFGEIDLSLCWHCANAHRERPPIGAENRYRYDEKLLDLICEFQNNLGIAEIGFWEYLQLHGYPPDLIRKRIIYVLGKCDPNLHA